MNDLIDSPLVTVGTVVPRTNETTGVTRYWLVQSASGPATVAMAERAITEAAFSGSVGAKLGLGGDGVEPARIEVVELVPRESGAASADEAKRLVSGLNAAQALAARLQASLDKCQAESGLRFSQLNTAYKQRDAAETALRAVKAALGDFS